MSLIESEINQQPQAIETLLAEEAENISRIAAAIREQNPSFICIAARGTSDNAARYAQYLFGIRARLAVALATPSVHTLYQQAPMLADALVIGISQSGQSEDVRRVLADARDQGALTLSITNDPDSPLAASTAHHIYLHAGDERSVAATKTYTTELAAIAMLVGTLTDDQTFLDDLRGAPKLLSQTLETAQQEIPNWAQRYRYIERYAVLGRGYNYATAFEISLKIKELCYITGEEYSEADFRHGPIALVHPGYPVILIAAEGAVLAKQIDLLHKLNERGAECVVISNAEATRPLATRYIALPAAAPEWLTPLLAVVPGQVFAMHLAKERGLPLDAPRGLNKVTVTE